MRVYLVRHGDAIQDREDAECSLSKKGNEDIKHIAQFLKHQSLEVAHIYYSGLLRARQTAEIIAKAIHFNKEMTVFKEMQPYDSISPLTAHLNQATDDILLVGHMPFLGLLINKCVTGDEHQDILYFHKGTTVCLERIEHSHTWLIEWCVVPQVVE